MPSLSSLAKKMTGSAMISGLNNLNFSLSWKADGSSSPHQIQGFELYSSTLFEQ
jgi:hypothetical protein